MQPAERRQLRMFVRRDTYGRYVSVLVYLPRDRYNTAVRERFAQILKEQLRAASRSSSPSASASPRPPGCTSSSTRPRARQIPDVDIADLERRLTEASRSWRDDFTAAVDRGVRRGASARGSAARYADSFPEAYKEDFPPRTGAVDLGRLEAIIGDDRASTSRSTSALDAGRGEARLKVFRIGAPLSLSEVLPMLSSMGVEVVDERPYELEGARRARRTSTSSGCATAARCPTSCASCSRTRSARCGTATTRSTASTRWCSAPG